MGKPSTTTRPSTGVQPGRLACLAIVLGLSPTLAPSAALAQAQPAPSSPAQNPPERAVEPAPVLQPGQGDPASDPALNDPALRDVIDRTRPRDGSASRSRDVRNAASPASAPPPVRATPALRIPGLEALGLGVPSGRVFPEGTFLSGLRGTLVRSGDFVALKVTDGPADATPATPRPRVMLLLPSQRLAQLLTATSAMSPETVVILSGQAFTYRDVPQLLPSDFSIEASIAAPSPAATTPAASSSTTPPPGPAPAPAADPTVDDLIRDMESTATPGIRTFSPTRPASSADDAQSTREDTRARAADSGPLIPDGSPMLNRRGRLVRLAAEGGRLAFVVDNGAAHDMPQPLLILPCRALESMEWRAGQSGDEAVFIVSGRVYAFRGKNYLLPTLFRTPPRTDIRGLQ